MRVTNVYDASSQMYFHSGRLNLLDCFQSVLLHFYIFADISWVARLYSTDEQQKAMVNSSEHNFHRDLIEQK